MLIAYLINLSILPTTGHAVAFGLQPMVVIGVMGIEFVVIVMAAMIPAERATRLRLADALQYE